MELAEWNKVAGGEDKWKMKGGRWVGALCAALQARSSGCVSWAGAGMGGLPYRFAGGFVATSEVSAIPLLTGIMASARFSSVVEHQFLYM